MATVSHGHTPFHRRHRFSSSSPTPTPARTGHYRPFSTLYTESPYVEIPDKSRCIHKRYSSIGGMQAFAHMGIGFIDKAKAKLNPPPVAEPIEIKISTPTQLPPTHHDRNAFQRPSNSSGTIIPTPTLHRVRKKRSMASLFATTDSSASSASGSAPHLPGPHHLPSPSQSIDEPTTSNSSASSIKKTRFINYDYDHDDSSKRFIPKSIWAKRHNMKLHPYHQDVPYMQAYDPILLDSDRYSDLLLQRLTHGSPSFHDYGKKPPATVLDLGCGPGHWVLHAATVWKTSQITGLDIVDLTLPGFETTENAHFVLGNFVAFDLPFPDNSFDYVRMANLVLCIPYEKWDYVLAQVRRVLTVNGKVELIDDQIFFPYGTAPKPRSWSQDMSDDSDFDEDRQTLQGSGSDAGSTLHANSEPSNSSCEEKPPQIVESPTLRPIASYKPPTPVKGLGSPCLYPGAAFDTESRQITWHSQATASRELESIFEIMLKQKYKIFPRPSDFVLNRMECVFGNEAAGKTRSYHIKLAPIDSADAGPGQGADDGEGMKNHFDGFSMKKAWMSVDREKAQKKEKKLKKNKEISTADTSAGSGSSSERSSLEDSISVSSTGITTPVPPSTSTKAAGRLGIAFTSPKEKPSSPPVPSPSPSSPSDQTEAPILSAKAADRLGISYSDLAAATVASAHQRPGASSSPSSPLQSPGLIVWPSTFIPLVPTELEMHANKYVHTLLGCKPALAEFVAQFVDENGTRFVNDDDFHDIMWTYECFRRSRFNWPAELLDSYDDEASPVSSPPIFPPPLLRSKSGSKSSKNSLDSYNGPDSGKELTHIRTIRVFEATKSERSLASLLFHHKTSPTS